MIRVNVGCGSAPVKGWKNYDDSIGLVLVKYTLLISLARRLKLLGKTHEDFICAARKYKIDYADAARRIPEADNSVEVLYASHLLEHLDKEESSFFLKECRRILIHGGILRISVPDLGKKIDRYIKTGNSDEFILSLLLVNKKPKTLLEKLKFLAIGERNHKWMYDGKALCNLVASAGFVNPHTMDAGKTGIPDPGDLDLFERAEESVYIEAKNP